MLSTSALGDETPKPGGGGLPKERDPENAGYKYAKRCEAKRDIAHSPKT